MLVRLPVLSDISLRERQRQGIEQGMVATMDSTLGWLHLSDLHFFGRYAARDDGPLEGLIEDLKAMLARGLRVDLVVCTGDIGFGETKTEPLAQQYVKAKAFFERVLQVCNLGSDRLFLVPGNHDIDRSKVLRSQTAYFRSDDRSLAQINLDVANKDAEISGAMARLSAYKAFIGEHYPHLKLDHNLTYGAFVEINGVSIAISGLNSAWTCVDELDEKKMWLAGESQLYASKQAINALAGAVKPQLRLGLMHHPRSWLQPAEDRDLRGHLENSFDFLLHGHTHDAWVYETNKPLHTVIAAGASTGESVQEFGYNLVQVRPGQAQVHLRSFDQGGGRGWIEKNIAQRTEQGVWPVAAPANLPSPPCSVTPAPEPRVSPPSTPQSRGHYGLESALTECSKRLAQHRLLAVFGMAGVGKSSLVEELSLRPEWRSLRLLTITAREDGGITDFFGQIAALLGIHDERPRPPAETAIGKLATALRQMASDVQPFFIHVQRAHFWFRQGSWQDAALSRLLEGLVLAFPGSAIVLETREKPETDLSSYEVTGIPRQVLADYLRNPPGLSAGWVLSGDQRKYVFSRLGGGQGQGAHAFGLTLLVRLAEQKQISPYDVLMLYPHDYAETLYNKLFRDLYQNVLSEGERKLLFACSLYRDGVHYSHLPRLEGVLAAEDAGAALIRRRLLAENDDWLRLHDLAAEQARNLTPDESRTQDLHQTIASYWLDELRGQKNPMEANVRRALEALYHLEKGGQGERVVEIAPVLFGRRPEETVATLWRMNNRYFGARPRQDKQICTVLEYLLKVSPDEHQAMRFLGECRRRLFGSRDQDALSLFVQATRLHPVFPQYWANYGHAAIATEDQAVIEGFLAEVAKAPERARDDHVQAIYAIALEAAGQDDEAAILRQAKIEADCRDPAFYADHAKWLLEKQSDPPGAIKVLEKARKMHCSNDITEAIYATALEADGQEGVAASLRRARIEAGNASESFFADHAKWLLDKQGDHAGALEVLAQARKQGKANSAIESIHARAVQRAQGRGSQ